MKRSSSSRYIPRRTLLACGSAAAASMFLRPLFAAASGASPTRLLIIHRPCGSSKTDFFPQGGDNSNFTLSPILQPLAKVKDSMTIINGITCPRINEWPGDKHAAGMIAMMTGKKPILPAGADGGGDDNTKFIVGADKSIDQLLLSTSLGDAPITSLQAAAYQPSSVGLSSFKVMSYTGPNGGLFPESRPNKFFNRVFGTAMAGLTPTQVARLRAQQATVLDFVHKDLKRLRDVVPTSQLPKLDAHLDGLNQLDRDLTAADKAALCDKPAQIALPAAIAGASLDEAQHLAVAQNQLATITAAFQCDLTRVATFSFAHGNSALRFQDMANVFKSLGVPTVHDDDAGHHDLSHQTTTIARTFQSNVDQFYCTALAQLLEKMKAIPDGDGSLLDNTLVVFLSEVAIGDNHEILNMPILMFGGKKLKLQTGKHLHYNGRYMNDVWAAVAGAFGAPATFGDAMFSKGAVTDLIG